MKTVPRIDRIFLASASAAAFCLAAAAQTPPEPQPKPPLEALAAEAAGPSVAAPALYAAVQPRERPETRIGDSGLPVPRYVSLKSGEVYLREGPSAGHKVEWVYVRRGLPVEVIAEYDVWRRIRDADGITGWVHKGMLDGRRSVLVTGEGNVALREGPSADAAIIAYAEPGVVARLKTCGSAFCEVETKAIDAYVARDHVWGVYATRPSSSPRAAAIGAP